MEKKSWEESEKRKSQERRSEKRKSQTVRRKKMQVRKKVEKVAKHSVLQFFVAGRKVGSLKRRVRSHLCDEKLHAAMARSTFRSQNVQNTLFRSLLEDEMLRKFTALSHEARFEVKMHKVLQPRSTFGS